MHDYDPVNRYEFTYDAFQVQTQPIAHNLCGDLSYTASFNSVAIDATSTPMAHDAARTFAIYSEDFNLVGLNQIEV